MASKIFYDCGCMEQGDQFFGCGKHRCSVHEIFDPRCETCPHCLQAESLKRLAQLSPAQAPLKELPTRSEIWDRYEMAVYGKIGNTIEKYHGERLDGFFDWLLDAGSPQPPSEERK